MSKSIIALGVAALMTTFAVPAFAQEEAAVQPTPPEAINDSRAETEGSNGGGHKWFEASLEFALKSAYQSHNRIFSDTPVAQYDIWLQANLPKDLGWLAVDIWANQELNKRHSSVDHGNGGKRLGGFGEFDYEIVYGNSVGPVDFTASHLWYTYPRCGWHAQKFLTLGAKYNNEFVTPSVKLFWEYGHIHNENKPDDCFMIDFELSRKFGLEEFVEGLTFTLTSKTTLYTEGYAKYRSGGEITEPVFGGWDNGIKFSYVLYKDVTLGAHLNYLYKVDHRVRHCPGWDSYSVGGVHGTRDGLLYGGVSIGVEF